MFHMLDLFNIFCFLWLRPCKRDKIKANIINKKCKYWICICQFEFSGSCRSLRSWFRSLFLSWVRRRLPSSLLPPFFLPPSSLLPFTLLVLDRAQHHGRLRGSADSQSCQPSGNNTPSFIHYGDRVDSPQRPLARCWMTGIPQRWEKKLCCHCDANETASACHRRPSLSNNFLQSHRVRFISWHELKQAQLHIRLVVRGCFPAWTLFSVFLCLWTTIFETSSKLLWNHLQCDQSPGHLLPAAFSSLISTFRDVEAPVRS